MVFGHYLDRCTFRDSHDGSSAIECGVSGGADSSALLILASEYGKTAGCDVIGKFVDHGLRAEAEQEGAKVKALCEQLCAGFVHLVGKVEEGSNLEARARDLRHGLLGSGCFLGHTADDQAETVLIRLMRGSGTDGLAAMRADRRPILRLRRADTEAICKLAGYEPVEDPSNRDLRFVRNRVRKELIPLMNAIAGRDVVPLLCRTAAIALEESNYLSRATDAAGVDWNDCAAICAADAVIAKRSLRSGLEADGVPPDMAAIERVLAVAAGTDAATEILGGRRVENKDGRLIVSGGKLRTDS